MAASALVLAAALVCTAPPVHDGDTLTCQGRHVRLWGMDAPETDGSPRCRRSDVWACDPAAERWAIPARRRLLALTSGRITCTEAGRSSYGRMVARCEADGADLGGVLVREGLARDWPRYSHGAYAADELRARRQHLGMWSAP